MFFEKRFLKVIDQIRLNAPVPLRIELWNDRQFDFCSNPNVTVTIPSSSALRYSIFPNLNKLGEAFVEGHIQVQGSPKHVFEVAEGLARSMTAHLPSALARLTPHNRHRDREVIAYHYDVSNDFYALFLDSAMVYSCAYYRHDDDTLVTAQEHKLDHILNKLRLQPGEKFLDIGCSWALWYCVQPKNIAR